MELRLLEYFITVCDELHFTRAAERLGISQPTLSQQIRLLEGRIGAPLFLRLGKKIHLTEEGKLLLKHAKRVFVELDQASMEIKQFRGIERGKLTIGCSGYYLLFPYITSFHELYPNIELSAHDKSTEETINKLMDREYDLGLVFLPVEHNHLKTIRLFTSYLSVVVSNTHPLAAKQEIELKELQQASPLFLLHKNYIIRQDFDRYCEEKGIYLKPLIELSDIESLLKMTILYNGITILPTIFLKSTSQKNFHAINISDLIPNRDVGLIFRDEKFMSATQQAFIEHLTNK